eukprot:scaffold678305_cov47-Prasinocladus_malaysianus.AAC.2
MDEWRNGWMGRHINRWADRQLLCATHKLGGPQRVGSTGRILRSCCFKRHRQYICLGLARKGDAAFQNNELLLGVISLST